MWSFKSSKYFMPKMCVFRCLISLLFLCTEKRAHSDWVAIVRVLCDILTCFVAVHKFIDGISYFKSYFKRSECIHCKYVSDLLLLCFHTVSHFTVRSWKELSIVRSDLHLKVT